MKKLFVSAVGLLFFSALKAQGQNKFDTAFSSELMQLAYKRIEAFDLGDTAIWSPYVANEYIIATPTGKVITKADVMNGFGPPTPGYKDIFRFEDVHVIRDANLAVMSYKIKEHEWWGKQENDVPDLRKTDTYIFRDGRWQLLASHETFYPVSRKPVSINPTVFTGYVGRFQVMPSLIYTVSKEKDKLYIQENNNPQKAQLFPLSATTFFSLPDTGFFNEGGVGVVEFVTDHKRSAIQLVFRRYDAIIRAQKLK